MNFSKEEIYELNQMLDERFNRFNYNISNFWSKIDKMPDSELKDKICRNFIKEASKEYDVIMTLRAKVNNNG